MSRILITGGSGMIGSRLTSLLLARGYEVVHLERSVKGSAVKTFLWDIARGQVDNKAFEGVHAVIHLAGANIGGGRWTAKRKKEILDSRVESTRLLHRELGHNRHEVKTFLCASAVGYYGSDDGDALKGEGDQPGSDFLAKVTKDWEAAASDIAALDIRVVRMRTGVVLSPKGGALEPMAKQVRLGLGAPLGTGRQYMSWVHLDDHCEAYIYALEHDAIHGPYNSVAPQPVTNQAFTREIAHVLKKPLFLPHIPRFIIRMVLGEMSVLVLDGCRVSSEKLVAAGFTFRHPKLEDALQDVLKVRR
ncbi:MAG TPA: TIGR01777 family oxidoreductase [Chryseolinea sp.]|nr:TIGR01777 family oxidoreductase [Chryseolinea sp.]